MDDAGLRSRTVDFSDLPWAEIRRHRLSPETIRTLRYMQDIESHTIIYLRTLLATRAIDDPEVATFLACWFHEETFHGRALARFLDCAGASIVIRQRSRMPIAQRIEALLTSALARAWPQFVAVHMAWGAINELTTLTGYRRLAAVAGHPILAELLHRIMRDESRHFRFYYRQAEQRLRCDPRAARITRLLVDRFWAPVGSGVQPAEETRFLAAYLFSGGDGRAAARHVDARVRRLPGFENVALLEAWIEREAPSPIAATYALPAGSAISMRSSPALTS